VGQQRRPLVLVCVCLFFLNNDARLQVNVHLLDWGFSQRERVVRRCSV
jgi:hypothetical protein